MCGADFGVDIDNHEDDAPLRVGIESARREQLQLALSFSAALQ
jgi:hypothetical protein